MPGMMVAVVFLASDGGEVVGIAFSLIWRSYRRQPGVASRRATTAFRRLLSRSEYTRGKLATANPVWRTPPLNVGYRHSTMMIVIIAARRLAATTHRFHPRRWVAGSAPCRRAVRFVLAGTLVWR